MTANQWAELRQVGFAALDHAAAVRTATELLALGPGFGDPLLAELGLADFTAPVGLGTYVEVLAPATPGHPVARWLGKVGGSSGWVLSTQVPSLDGVKERAAEHGVRVAVETQARPSCCGPGSPRRWGCSPMTTSTTPGCATRCGSSCSRTAATRRRPNVSPSTRIRSSTRCVRPRRACGVPSGRTACRSNWPCQPATGWAVRYCGPSASRSGGPQPAGPLKRTHDIPNNSVAVMHSADRPW